MKIQILILPIVVLLTLQSCSNVKQKPSSSTEETQSCGWGVADPVACPGKKK